MYENFTVNKISNLNLSSEIGDLLVDLTDLGFEWYFPNFINNNIHISILKDSDESYPGVDFKVDNTLVDCVNTLVDWIREKYGISSVSYRLSLVKDIDLKRHTFQVVTKDFGEEELGLLLYEITIILIL